MDNTDQRDSMLHGRNNAEIRSESNNILGLCLDIKQSVAGNFRKYIIIFIGVSIIFISIILLILYSKYTIPGIDEQICIKSDYTTCHNVDNTAKTCFESVLDNNSQTCTCEVNIDLSHDMRGNVTLYYELEKYNQTEQIYSRSRDDKQLSGILSQTPSPDCGDYAVSTNGRPIAPCGLVADTMFTDSYTIMFNNVYLDVVNTGLVSKVGYHNPPVNLALVLRNFTTPKSWLKNVWELDPNNTDNNGFQNERFIAWMRKDLKMKPALRLNKIGIYKDGLPPGTYKIRIVYAYPLSRYNGSRIVSICNEKDCINQDYTKCTNAHNTRQTCFDTLLDDENPTCVCYVLVNVTRYMKGEIMLMYELKSFDQTEHSYARSRDDKQLAGILSQTPSLDCGEYAYGTDGRPIAPCGLVADSMFTDSFALGRDDEFLSVLYTGLVNKTGYQNPPPNLTESFIDFDKPKNWVKNIWELDPGNPENNGFQNEAFIVWMRTDLKRKPAWRLNQMDQYKDGLPTGLYTIRISYAYPVNRYNGSRVLWLCGEQHSIEVLVRSGLICFLVALIIFGILVVGFALFETDIRNYFDKKRNNSQ